MDDYYDRNPDDAPPPPPHSFLESLVDNIDRIFLHRNDNPPPVDDFHPKPVVDDRLSSPPYPPMTTETRGRYQQEKFGVLLAVAGVKTAQFQTRTRCDFFTLFCFAAGAVAVDANDGVWVELSGTPPSVPTLTAGQFQPVPFRLNVGGALQIHGAEQQFSVTLDSTIDLIVIVTCNTNVPSPYV